MVRLCLGGLYCPPGGVPVKTRGGPGRPCLTAQHVWSAGDQGAIAGSQLYRFRSQHTPSSIPQAVGLLFPGRRGCVFGRDQARRGRPGDNRRYFGQHCSAWQRLYSSLLFCLFFSLACCLCRDMMWTRGGVADMMDGIGVHG